MYNNLLHPIQDVPGVLRFLTHKDIPTGGYNSFVSKESAVTCSKQEVLCSGKVLYAGQPVGIIVAGTEYNY